MHNIIWRYREFENWFDDLPWYIQLSVSAPSLVGSIFAAYWCVRLFCALLNVPVI